MAERSACRTRNPAVRGSSHALTTTWICFSVARVQILGHACKYKCWNRELTLKCKLKCYEKPMKDPLGVSPSKGSQGTTRGKEKFLLTSVGIEPTTSELDLTLLCRLSYEVGQRKLGTI